MARVAGYRGLRPARATAATVRAAFLALLALALPGTAAAGTGDLAVCLDAKPTLQGYVDELTARGWTSVAEADPDHDRVSRATGEIIGTLRSLPRAFSAPQQVRAELDRIRSLGRRDVASASTALLARDALALMVVLRHREGESRVTCYLGARSIPDVVRRLPEAGRNPSGDPLAWNVMSSGALDTPHVFAEIMYVRLFFQPAQHLLAGGQGVVTHLTFRRDATAI